MLINEDADRALAFMKDNHTLQKLRLHGNDHEPMVDDGELFSVRRSAPDFLRFILIR
jgi:hypothetical protein